MPPAIVLEAGNIQADLSGQDGSEEPGLLEINGQTLAERVVQAFRECAGVGPVVLAGPPSYRGTTAAAAADRFFEMRSDPARELVQIVEQLDRPESLLLYPANAPLVTATMIENFLRHAPEQAHVAYAVLRAEKVRDRFPSKRDWPQQNFTDGPIVLSPLVRFAPRVLDEYKDLISSLVMGEINPWEVVNQLGLSFVLRLKMGRVSLGELARRVSEIIGGQCAAVISPYPEIGFLVQTRADLRLAEQELGGA